MSGPTDADWAQAIDDAGKEPQPRAKSKDVKPRSKQKQGKSKNQPQQQPRGEKATKKRFYHQLYKFDKLSNADKKRITKLLKDGMVPKYLTVLSTKQKTKDGSLIHETAYHASKEFVRPRIRKAKGEVNAVPIFYRQTFLLDSLQNKATQVFASDQLSSKKNNKFMVHTVRYTR